MAFTRNHQTNSFSLPSSSSSLSSSHWNHDVFLSFRGTDTRKTFTGHLYTALKQAGIRPFMDDDELPTGKEIKQELKKAIHESKMYIIVFSENYASSRWCLDELVEIIECKNTMGRLVIPLFYHVDPSVVRYQSGSYAKAFQHFVAVLEKRKVEKPPPNLLTRWLSWVGRKWKSDSLDAELELKKMEKWRAALTEAANLSGHDLRTEENGNESRFIQKIVSKVVPQVIPGCLTLPDNPVGIGCRVKEINQLLSIESNEARTIGIHGMGGIGKTTISKAVFNENLHRFEVASFVENIKDDSKPPDSLLRLQEKLLCQLMKRPDVKVFSVDHGIEFINRICHSKRVLILLDDLDDLIQVKSLAPFAGQRCFSSGSRVIITTRDVQLLKQVQVDADYEVTELDENESLELFSWHAFRRAFPPEDYQLISEGIVRYAKGLPLVLEVIGSYLVQKTTKEWESTLNRLHQIPDTKVQDKLQISFDALGEDKAKDIFLDLACFFIGMDKYFATNIWDACGYFPEDGISNLKSKSLLKIDPTNCLRMHEQLRDMGREIIRKESPKWPEKRSRLWLHEDVIDVLTNHKGTKEIEGISLDLSCLEPIHLDAGTFGAMCILRLLQINNVHLTGCFENIFKELRWLSWHYCPLECLPSEFCPGKLVMLDMKYSKFNELWQGVKHLDNLKILDLSFCKFLVKTPNFVGTKSLERLMLRGCESLIEVHPSIGLLRRLHYLDLRECKNLKNIPSNICDLGSLEDLLLYECSNLEKLPEQIGNIKCLRSLDVSYNVNITELPDSIGLLCGLVQLNLGNCENLKTLPNSICNLSSLVRLNLSGCSNLEQLPEQLGNIECLLYLDLSDCKKLIHLPTSICNMRLLEDLYISHLSNLERLPEELGNMNCLRRLFANGTAIKELPDSIGLLSKLVDLSLKFCVKLEVLPSSICDLRSLEELNLNFCSNLTQLPEQLGNMKVLRTLFTNGTAFKWFPDSIQLLKNLKELALDGRMNSHAPLSLFKRFVLPFKSTLRWLELHYCSLCDEDIPDDIGLYLSSLTHLNLSGNKFCTLPSSLGQLSNLLKLTLSNCTSLVSLPELPHSLYEFDASGCTSLEKLPNLSNLKYLFQLDLTDCSRLVEVQGLENLNSLQYVHMAGCNNLEISTLKNFFQRYFEHADEIILPRWEIPQWFTDQRMESSISFNMPPTPTNNFQGIIFWVVYVKSDIYCDHPNYYSAVIKNKTSGITWIHGRDVFKHTSRVEGHSWVTCIQGHLLSKDTIEISINELENGVKVERCGIHFLYKPDISVVDIYDRKRGRDVDLHLSNEESAKRLRT